MRLSATLWETISSVQKLIKHDLNIVTHDKYIMSIKAGAGGTGLARYNGVGGNGGDVYFIAKPNLAFTDIKKRLKNKMKIRSSSGAPSTKTCLIGAHGRPENFDVPIGIEVVDRSTNTLIARCSRPFHRYLIARGGQGGSSCNSYKGTNGDMLEVEIHLKLRPNVGLLGFPNAGKSTLLKALVPEKSVKIADYPFTTINPQLAFWNVSSPSTSAESFLDSFTLSVADLPGIIEGAHRNRGRGYQFLKHLEYADVIVMVIDCTGFQLKNSLDCPFRSPIECIALINRELELYDEKLARKPALCVLNKIDLLDEHELKKINTLQTNLLNKSWINTVPQEFKPKICLRFESVIQLSAKNGSIEGFRKSLNTLRHHIHPLSDVKEEKEDFRKNPKLI